MATDMPCSSLCYLTNFVVQVVVEEEIANFWNLAWVIGNPCGVHGLARLFHKELVALIAPFSSCHIPSGQVSAKKGELDNLVTIAGRGFWSRGITCVTRGS